jgi:DNA-binding MarR family transcriptional regulator
MIVARNLTIASGFTLWRAAMRWQRAVDKSLAPLGMTHTQYLVLSSARSAVDEVRDAVSQRVIATQAGVDEVTASRLIRKLEARGWLDRGPTFGDLRALRVIVTRSGRRILEQATSRLEAALKSPSGDARGDAR